MFHSSPLSSLSSSSSRRRRCELSKLCLILLITMKSIIAITTRLIIKDDLSKNDTFTGENVARLIERERFYL